MQSKLLTTSIVLQADITNNVENERRGFLGVFETIFKDKCDNHIEERKRKRYCNASELSKYVLESKKEKNSLNSLENGAKIYGNLKRRFYSF